MIKDLYPFIQAYSLIIGLAVGSFLNVIIYRLPNNKSIVKPRSSAQDVIRKSLGTIIFLYLAT